MDQELSSSSSESSIQSLEKKKKCPHKTGHKKKHKRSRKKHLSESAATSDPALYDIDPQMASLATNEDYKAAMCCRIGDTEPTALSRLHKIMEKVVGPASYKQFVGDSGVHKPLEDNMVVRNVMDMLEMKNKVMLATNELPKAFEKIASSHAASRYRSAVDAAEHEMRNIFDDEKAEEAAVKVAGGFRSDSKNARVRPQPKITVLGYIGCYDECEKHPKKKCESWKK